MRTLEPTPAVAENHARRTATQVARFIPGARVGHSDAGDHRLEWSIVMPAARGTYVATVTVVDDPDTDDRSLTIAVEGLWAGTDTGFQVPGGVSRVFDFGEPVTVQHSVVSSHIISSLDVFEKTSPSMALQLTTF